jgi:DNA repair protein RecN (Recombination protein N)
MSELSAHNRAFEKLHHRADFETGRSCYASLKSRVEKAPVLVELRLENYAVVDSLVVEFAAGLNLLTGETGAGKSILIDALTLLLGAKASADVVRSGTERAVIAAVFEMEDAVASAVGRILEENGLDAESDSLILRRELSAGGKGRVFVNNQPATVATLRSLAPYLAAVHAQNETLSAFDGPARLALLDAYAQSHLSAVHEAYAEWKALRDRIEALQLDEQDRLRLVDLWTYQTREIEQANLRPAEDGELENEKRVLANAEKIYNAAMNAFDLLYEGNASAAASLRAAQKQLEELARYDAKFQESLSALEAALISVEDVGAGVRDYAGGIEASPEHLAEVEDRLAILDRLKRKYGPSLEDTIRFGEDAARKLSEVENKDEILQKLQQELNAAAEHYLAAARALSKKRFEAARKLEKQVEAGINDLAMRASFQIEVNGSDDATNWSPSGFDHVIYMIATNAGEPMRRLEHIASGGELSRVMLALKAAVESGPVAGKRKTASVPRTLVFDEIDTGIGGRAAEAVGKKLKDLSRASQVLCVTHLPQIATFADHHYLIEKKQSGGRARAVVRPISGDERKEEVARMLSGAKVTESSLKHAEQMLKANG